MASIKFEGELGYKEMTYKLCKKLKDAGFPQDWTEWEDHDQELLQKNWDMYGKGYSPTLSELIEACGDNFARLLKTDKWSAGGGNPDFDDSWEFEGYGETREIAVANLWLELNKKA